MKDKEKRLFIICLYGVYGGQWYCAVYAKDEEEANKKGKNKYNINKDTWKDFENHIPTPSNSNIEVEFIFDEDGVSNLWYLCW